MRIDVLTTFPEVIECGIGYSIVKRAREKGILNAKVHNLRHYTHDRHQMTDDEPFGHGIGMVMKPEPIFEAVETIVEDGDGGADVILMTPQGRTFDQDLAKKLSGREHLIIICGHYEGVDDRVREHLVTDEISVGDFILTGGELPALVVIDAVTRLLPGVLGAKEAAEQESFEGGLLEYPQYTRPAEFRGWRVPDVLLSGHHAEIDKWRREQSLRLTLERRPDLIDNAKLSKEDRRILDQIKAEKQTGG